MTREAGAVPGKDLLTDATDRQNATAQGDLAGHADKTIYRPTRKSRNHGSGDGNSRRGAILGYGAFGHVQMDVHALEDLHIDAEGGGRGT